MAIQGVLTQSVSNWVSQLRDASTITLIALTVVALLTFRLASSVWRFYVNYRAAVRTGLPIRFSLVDPNAAFFMPFQQVLRPLIIRYTPEWFAENQITACYGWEHHNKLELHRKVGNSFILVSPGPRNEIWLADPDQTNYVMHRRKEFVGNEQGKIIIGLCGENLFTSDGDNWSRQRRLIAPNFNERVSEAVWDETTEQAAGMADYIRKQPNLETNEVPASLRAIAINVLSQISYGQQRGFKPLDLPRDPNRKMTYVDAISLVCELIVLPAVAPHWFWSLPIMPKLLQTLGAALRQIPDLTRDMLEQERKRQASNMGEGKPNMLNMLVRISDAGKKEEAKGESKNSLSEVEISGNLFNFTAAGFDTTANTLAYAFVLLAAHPELQAWVQEELDEVFGKGKPVVNQAYSDVFPKLQRCQSVLFETLRMFPAIPHLPRGIDSTQTIPSATPGGRPHVIDRPTDLYINNVKLHHEPSIWGQDSFDFRPARWLDSAGQVITPAKGTFNPWGLGPRICPGMRMAQVEFVAIIAGLLSRFTFDPIQLPGESLMEARKRQLDIAQNSDPRMTLQLARPEDVKLRFNPRS